MLKVALTGNIGSGKSTVSRIFGTLHVPVFVADEVAKQLYEEEVVKEQVLKLFGKVVFSPSGEVNFQALASIVFNDKKALRQINELIHPITLSRYEKWVEANKDARYTIHESAILFENKLQHHFDKLITVTAPEEIRIKRIVERDGLTIDKIRERMNNQISEETKTKLSDFVINNDGSEYLIPQVMKIDKQLRS